MDKPLYVQSVGSVYFDASKEGIQPDLKQQTNEVCTQRFRRIDRFTQLALIGSAMCIGEPLHTLTALYLATGKGPAANNIAMQQDIFRDRNAPMPIRFINSVSNSVSFYVMKNLGLTGQNLLLSREMHAFEAAVEMAATDLHTGRVNNALVGMVDEITHPVEDQCRRLRLPLDTQLGEGSHWVLLSAQKTNKSIGSLNISCLFDCEADLIEWLTQHQFTRKLSVFFELELNAPLADRCMASIQSDCNRVESDEGYWDGLNAGVIASFLTRGNRGELLVISQDTSERCQITLVKIGI